MKKAILLMLLSLLVTSSNCSYASLSPRHTPLLHATWAETYSTYHQMEKAADLIIKGIIQSEECFQQGKLTFTNYTILTLKRYKGNCGNTVSLIMTGGSTKKSKTSFIEDTPLLQVGDERLFLLNLSTQMQNGIESYYLAGGYQGCLSPDYLNTPVTKRRSLREELDAMPSHKSGSFGSLNARWYKKNVSYRYPYQNAYSPAAISAAFSSWSSVSSELNLYNWNSPNADIQVEQVAYGNVGWIGLMQPSLNYSGEKLTGADIFLNTLCYPASRPITVKRYRLACLHEIGHSLGLFSHYEGSNSIMRSSALNLFPSNDNNTPTSPGTYDKTLLRSIYGY